MDERTLRESIDACRPGSDDMEQPEMSDVAQLVESDSNVRQLYLSVQRDDESLANVFRDVPVPDGIEERILTAMARNDVPPAPTDIEPGPHVDSEVKRQTASPVDVTMPGRRFKSKRRSAWWVAAAVGAAASVIWFSQLLRPPLTEHEFIALASEWKDNISDDRWSVDLNLVPRGNLPSRGVLSVSPRRWQRLATPEDPACIAFDVSSQPRKVRAVLLVLNPRRKITGLPTRAPALPQSDTGGWCVGAWQTDGRIHVLLVQGSRRRYQTLLNRSAPLVQLSPGKALPVLLMRKV